MRLDVSYYKIEDSSETEGGRLFEISLQPHCKVYEGHFPGNPVSPGACNMQMIKELAEKIAGTKLHMSSIRQCRLMAVLSPQNTPRLSVNVGLAPSKTGYSITASIANADTLCLTFKGEMTR